MVDPASQEGADEMVRAYYDPFFQMWYKIPDGFEAMLIQQLFAHQGSALGI